MPAYEYRVVPAPRQLEKAKGVKGTESRFAHTLTKLMNELGVEGWDYLRAETLPCEERRGLTGRAEVIQHVLVFRRALAERVEAKEPNMPKLGSAAFDRAGGKIPRLVLDTTRKDGA